MESIYNFVEKPKSEIAKEPLYRSKYDPKAPLTGSTFGLRGTRNTGKGVHELKTTCVISSTFGPTNKNGPDPTNFLKKGSKAKMPALPTQHERRISQKPTVPSRGDRPVMGLGLKTEKNFVTHNAANAILSAPPRLKQDDGDFMQQEDYGKVPEYLSKVKKEIQNEQEIIERHLLQQFASEENKEDLAPMDDSERQDLINALKRRWDAVNRQYQIHGHRVAIENGDIKRKEAQESELTQLESDIEKLSRPGPIMVRKQ